MGFHTYNKFVVLRKLKIYIFEQQQFLSQIVNVVFVLQDVFLEEVPHNLSVLSLKSAVFLDES